VGEENINFNSAAENQTDDFLHVISVKEDWGGDGRGRMNLSGRRTAISKEYISRQYQFFDTNAIAKEHGWRVSAFQTHLS
jgi:hypothetical protein